MSNILMIHVLLSLIGIFTGFIVVIGFLSQTQHRIWVNVFLITTLLTSVTGYMLPADKILPSHIVGGLSILVLLLAMYGFYIKRQLGGWHKVFIVNSLIALYFNVFVAIVQAFLKIPALHAIAPNEEAPAFIISQSFNLILFILIGYLTLKKRQAAAL